MRGEISSNKIMVYNNVCSKWAIFHNLECIYLTKSYLEPWIISDIHKMKKGTAFYM